MNTHFALPRQAGHIVIAMSLFLLVACGTIQVGVEPEPTTVVTEATRPTETPAVTDIGSQATSTPPASSTEAAVTPTVEPVESPTVAPSPTAAAELERLQVTYIKENNVWLWDEEAGPRALTKNGGVEDVLLSDDGKRIAFRRGGNIWVVNSDGTDERQLTAEADFEDISLGEDWDPFVLAIVPYQLAWRPGTHTLFFNTVPQLEGPGLLLTDDLWSVVADSGEPALLYPPGEGGNMSISPDGRFIALTTPGSISLLDGDGQNRRELFTYTPIVTYSEFQYYARPVWNQTSDALGVAIPPVDRLASPDQLTSIWTIPTDGTPARLSGNVAATQSILADPLLSPDLGRVAFFVDESTAAPPVFEIAISEIGENGVGDAIVTPFQAEELGSWSPDGQNLVFTPPYDGVVPRRLILTTQGDSIRVGQEEAAVFQVSWVDETRYIFQQLDGVRGWSLLLAGLGDDEVVIIDGGAGAPTSYDLAR